MPHEELYGFEFLQGTRTRIVNYARLFPVWGIEDEEQFYSLGLFTLSFRENSSSEAWIFEFTWSFPVSFRIFCKHFLYIHIYTPIKRDIWIEYQFYLHFLNMFILYRLCALWNVAFFVRIIRDRFKRRKILGINRGFFPRSTKFLSLSLILLFFTR